MQGTGHCSRALWLLCLAWPLPSSGQSLPLCQDIQLLWSPQGCLMDPRSHNCNKTRHHYPGNKACPRPASQSDRIPPRFTRVASPTVWTFVGASGASGKPTRRSWLSVLSDGSGALVLMAGPAPQQLIEGAPRNVRHSPVPFLSENVEFPHLPQPDVSNISAILWLQ